MASVLIERETVDKEELAALLGDRWDEFLKKEAAEHKDDPDADSAEKDESTQDADAEPEPERSGSVLEPPMAPGTPPVLGS